MKLTVNGKAQEFDVAENTPLLWVLRDVLGYTGTKYGCGVGACGACTVHVNGEPVRSCSIEVGDVDGDVTTIEALSKDGTLHAVQEAWIENQVAQCGYCQSGQIMSAVALLNKTPNPSDEDINLAMLGNICRCGAYPRIRAAIHQAAKKVGA